jgi:hypothetical protein
MTILGWRAITKDNLHVFLVPEVGIQRGRSTRCFRAYPSCERLWVNKREQKRGMENRVKPRKIFGEDEFIDVASHRKVHTERSQPLKI